MTDDELRELGTLVPGLLQLSEGVPLFTGAPTADMHKHLLVLFSLVRWLPGREVVEIGVRDGVSTLALLAGVGMTGGRLTSVDIAACPTARELVAKVPALAARWTFLEETDSVAAASLVSDAVLADLVMIDGDHSEEGCRRDLDAWAPRVRPGGMLVLHDYFSTYDGVSRAVAAWALDYMNRPALPGAERNVEVLSLPWGYGLTLVRIVPPGERPGVVPVLP